MAASDNNNSNYSKDYSYIFIIFLQTQIKSLKYHVAGTTKPKKYHKHVTSTSSRY